MLCSNKTKNTDKTVISKVAWDMLYLISTSQASWQRHRKLASLRAFCLRVYCLSSIQKNYYWYVFEHFLRGYESDLLRVFVCVLEWRSTTVSAMKQTSLQNTRVNMLWKFLSFSKLKSYFVNPNLKLIFFLFFFCALLRSYWDLTLTLN